MKRSRGKILPEGVGLDITLHRLDRSVEDHAPGRSLLDVRQSGREFEIGSDGLLHCLPELGGMGSGQTDQWQRVLPAKESRPQAHGAMRIEQIAFLEVEVANGGQGILLPD
jgi:hypothetical protein